MSAWACLLALTLPVAALPAAVPPTIVSGALVGSVYTQTLAAIGTGPIMWSVTSGSLPPGLSLGSSTGIISGTTAVPGNFAFVVTASNAAGSASQQWSLMVTTPPTPPSIVTTSLPAALTGKVYSQTLTATGTTPISWAVTSGALPPGLTLGSATGIISGTPTATGTFTITVSASNAGGSNSTQLGLTVGAPVAVSLTPSSVALQPSQNQTFTASVSGTSNTAVTWSLSPALGSLSGNGTTVVYVAPGTAPANQSVAITATSVADPSKIASAMITLLQAVTVSISPLAVSLAPSATQQFTATVLGTSNTAVNWSISPAVGSVSSTGLYIAPSSVLAPQAVTVTARSIADGTRSTSATVSLSAPTGFYVDSVNGSDANPGTQAAPWRTIAKVNSARLQPGQSVAFKAGGVWREQLTIWSVGSSGNPITFTSYGSGPAPIISGADVVSVWTSAAPYFYASYPTAPSQLFRNGVRLNQVSSKSALLAGTWWLDTTNSRIYVYDNPNANTMEISQRTYGVQLGGAYVNVNGLAVTAVNNEGIGIFTGSSYVTVSNCNVSNSYSNGIAVWSANPSMSNGIIQGNTVSDSGRNGISVSQNATYWTIQDNVVYGNSRIPTNNPYTAGIDLGGRSVSNITIQNNQVYSNGLGQLTNIGFGIHVDVESPNNVIRWNTANGNNDCNILVEISKNNQIYGNVVYGSIQGCGIGLRGASGTPASGNVVYNNTIYGNLSNQIWAGGLLVYGDGTPGSFINNTFENNIAVGNSSPQLNAFSGAENDGVNGYGNVYAHNDFGQATANFIRWGSAKYSTLTSWQAAAPGQGSNLSIDPRFTNPGAADFTLQSGSAVIGVGVYIPGVSTSNPPNIGAK